MSESEERKECQNCNKQILLQQYDLHEVYCTRHIIKCPQCKIPIEKTQLEEHNNYYHCLKQCQYCSKKFEAIQLEEHEKDCFKKPQICSFCFMPICYDDYINHVVYCLGANQCGARTEKCKYCQKNIMLCELLEHELYCELAGFEEKQKIKQSDLSVSSDNSCEIIEPICKKQKDIEENKKQNKKETKMEKLDKFQEYLQKSRNQQEESRLQENNKNQKKQRKAPKPEINQDQYEYSLEAQLQQVIQESLKDRISTSDPDFEKILALSKIQK